MTSKKIYYKNLAGSLIKKLDTRGMEGYYYPTAEEALSAAESFLRPGCSVSWGGSETLEEIGLIDLLKQSDFEILDRKMAKTPEEARKLYGKIVTADFYFMSSNAITMNGELVNIDGSGNRVSCLCYGPQQVIVVIGMNKVVPDVDCAVKRVRNQAAPPNCIRLSKDTPCAATGKCADCLKDDCICAQIVVTRKSMLKNRIKVLMVGEDLGF